MQQLKCPACGNLGLPFRGPHCSGLTCQRCQTILTVNYAPNGQPLSIVKIKRGNILAFVPATEVVHANL